MPKTNRWIDQVRVVEDEVQKINQEPNMGKRQERKEAPSTVTEKSG